MSKKIVVSAALCAAAGAGVLAAGQYFFHFACSRSSRILSSSADEDQPVSELRQMHRKAKADLLNVPYTEVEIISKDGLKLKGKYYPNPNAERAVLCAHGYRGSAEGDFGTIWQMLKDSCALLLIDERACGESEGQYITFGALEKDDIVRWANKLAGLTDGRLPVYLFGISLGSSTVLLTQDQGLCAEVKGIIADCGYSSMKKILGEVAWDWFRLPPFPLIDAVGLFCRLQGHFRMKDADVTAALRKAVVPVLFIHGTGDHFVRPHHTEINEQACACEHTTVLFEDAPHGSSCVSDPEKYRKTLEDFFRKTEESV